MILLDTDILISPPTEWPEGEVLGQAHSRGIPLMTRNAKDFELVSDVVEILEVA